MQNYWVLLFSLSKAYSFSIFNFQFLISMKEAFRFLHWCQHWAIFPCGLPQSIFTTAELNFCVRNGYRWTLCVCSTDSSRLYSLNIEQYYVSFKDTRQNRYFLFIGYVKDSFDPLHVLHRKEVIQPHLPIRLPCYDLTPIIEPTFDDCLLAVSPSASGVFNFHGLTGGVYKARERIHRGMLIRDY